MAPRCIGDNWGSASVCTAVLTVVGGGVWKWCRDRRKSRKAATAAAAAAAGGAVTQAPAPVQGRAGGRPNQVVVNVMRADNMHF